MEEQMHAQNVKLWESRRVIRESTYSCDDGSFPKYSDTIDLMGDTLDEYGDCVATELKSIALWGGRCHHKAALMAYNDYKCADAILGAIKHGVATPYPMGARDYSNIIEFAKLISSNRESLIRIGDVTDVPVTETERQDYAIRCYKNKRFFLKHPPKKAMTAILKRLNTDDLQLCDFVKRNKMDKARDDIEDYVTWDETDQKFKTSMQWLETSSIVSDLTDTYKNVHS